MQSLLGCHGRNVTEIATYVTVRSLSEYCHSELVSESIALKLKWNENLKPALPSGRQVQVDKQKDKKFGKFFHSTMKDVKKMKER